MSTHPLSPLADNLPSLRTLYTDIHLATPTSRHPAHRLLLHAHSPAIFGPLLSTPQTAATNEIQLHPSTTPDVVQALLDVLYTGTYHTPAGVDALPFHLRVWEVGTRHAVRALQRTAQANFTRGLASGTPAEIISAADLLERRLGSVDREVARSAVVDAMLDDFDAVAAEPAFVGLVAEFPAFWLEMEESERERAAARSTGGRPRRWSSPEEGVSRR